MSNVNAKPCGRRKLHFRECGAARHVVVDSRFDGLFVPSTNRSRRRPFASPRHAFSLYPPSARRPRAAVARHSARRPDARPSSPRLRPRAAHAPRVPPRRSRRVSPRLAERRPAPSSRAPAASPPPRRVVVRNRRRRGPERAFLARTFPRRDGDERARRARARARVAQPARLRARGERAARLGSRAASLDAPARRPAVGETLASRGGCAAAPGRLVARRRQIGRAHV